MTRNATLSLILAISLSPSAMAQNRQEFVDLDSKAYGYLDSLYLESGKAPPNYARPWSLDEFAYHLERLDETSLSEAGKSAFSFISSLVNARPAQKGLSSSIGIQVAPEGFIRIPLGGTAFKNAPYEWTHGYEERQSLLAAPLELWLDDWLFATTIIDIREERAAQIESNVSNLILDDPNPRIDLYFPFKAYTSLGGPGWSLRVGRDSINWGNGHTGNMVLSDWSDFYDFIAVSLYGKALKFSSVYATLDAWDPKTLLQSPSGYSGLAAHRLDFKATEWLSFALTEAVTFGGDNSEEADRGKDTGPDLIRDMNPLMIFHNWTIPERTNSMLSLEALVTPLPSVCLYAQVAMDEFATAYEEGLDGGGGPPVFGYLAGLKGSFPTGPGYLQVCLEGAMTSPWMYNRRMAPYYYNVRRSWSLTTNSYQYSVKPIGYRYGPDALLLFASTEWSVPAGPTLYASIVHATTGSTTIESAWAPKRGDKTPSGPYPTGLTSVELSSSLPLLSWLTVGGGASFTYRINVDHDPESWSADLELHAYLRAWY